MATSAERIVPIRVRCKVHNINEHLPKSEVKESNMSSVTKKHMEYAAKLVARHAHNDVEREHIAAAFIQFFTVFNPLFDEDRFREAVKLEDDKINGHS